VLIHVCVTTRALFSLDNPATGRVLGAAKLSPILYMTKPNDAYLDVREYKMAHS